MQELKRLFYVLLTRQRQERRIKSEKVGEYESESKCTRRAGINEKEAGRREKKSSLNIGRGLTAALLECTVVSCLHF